MSRSELKSGIAGTGQFCSLDELSANGLFTLEEVTRYTEAENRAREIVRSLHCLGMIERVRPQHKMASPSNWLAKRSM